MEDHNQSTQAQRGEDLLDEDDSYQPVGSARTEAKPAEQLQKPAAEPAVSRVALITGGAGAVATAVAMELARRGWSIFLQHSTTPAAAQETAAIRDASLAGAEVLTAAADLTTSAGREQLVEQVLEAFDRIDMLVNAAIPAASGGSDLLVLAEEEFRATMDAALTSTLFLTQHVANEMVRLVEAGLIENPKIVTISTLNAYITSIDSAPQCVSQAALGMMTRLFADRLGEFGINVYEIRMGILASGSSDQSYAKYDTLIAQGLTPIRRWGRPGDAARAVAAVAEDLLGFSTGEVIHVDGGFHIQRL